MYWALISVTAWFVAVLVAKRYPNLAPHISFGALSATGLVLAFVTHFIFYPQVESLYASFDENPTYSISPNVLFIVSLISYGVATALSFLSKRFQAVFDNTFRNRWLLLALILLMVIVLMSGYIVVVFSPIYGLSAAIK